jgi:hypothetical protein
MLEVKWTYHAIEETKKELAKAQEVQLEAITDEYAQLFIKDCMRQAKFISEIIDDKGKIDRLYAYRRYCFVLDRYDDVVITVYKRENVHEEIRELVQELLFEKLTSLEQTEALLEEERLAADIRVELIRNINRAINNNKQSSAADLIRIAEAKTELDAIERKLQYFRRKKSKLAKGIAAYI